MKIISSVYLIVLSISGIAQSPDRWSKGCVTLSDDKVVVGEFSHQEQLDLLVHRSVEGIKVLPLHQVKLLRYYDSAANINRQFLTIRDTHSFQQWKLYEVVVQGKMKVVRRLKFHQPQVVAVGADDYNYFVWNNSELISINEFRNNTYPRLLEDHAYEIKSFVETHHLGLRDVKSVILILKEYNKLQSQKRLMAQAD